MISDLSEIIVRKYPDETSRKEFVFTYNGRRMFWKGRLSDGISGETLSAFLERQAEKIIKHSESA